MMNSNSNNSDQRAGSETDDESLLNEKMAEEILNDMKDNNKDYDSDGDDSKERIQLTSDSSSSSGSESEEELKSPAEEELKPSAEEDTHTYGLRDRRTIKPAGYYKTLAGTKRNGPPVMSPDDLVANDNDEKPKATSKLKKAVSKTANRVLPRTLKKPRSSKTSGRSNSPKKTSPNVDAPSTIVQVKNDKRS